MDAKRTWHKPEFEDLSGNLKRLNKSLRKRLSYRASAGNTMVAKAIEKKIKVIADKIFAFNYVRLPRL